MGVLIMAIGHSGSSPNLCIVCYKKWSGVAICQSLRSGVREEVVVIAVVPQFSKGFTNNILIVFMYGLLAFEI